VFISGEVLIFRSRAMSGTPGEPAFGSQAVEALSAVGFPISVISVYQW
jgi:hypothetical protein